MSGLPQVAPVRGGRDLARFMDLPRRIYRADPCWVAPLRGPLRRTLDPERNPFFRHSSAQLFLARRGEEVVGRVAAIDNRRHLEAWDDGVGFFGFFECREDPAAAAALLDAARDWVQARGLAKLRGPTSFTINDECGVLLDAYDLPPVLLMAYNRPYYPALLEGCGLAKAQDLLAYRYTVPAETPARLAHTLTRAEGAGVRIRSVDLDRFDEELARIHRVHSAAWAENWGAVPLSVEEIGQLARDLLPVVDPELVLLAEADGETVGVSVTVPDLNQVLRHLHGRLLPFGWLRLAWQRRRIEVARVLILGVLAPWRHRGVDAALYARMLEVARRKGIVWGELSWILESNEPMRRILEGMGAEHYKTYRIYEGNA